MSPRGLSTGLEGRRWWSTDCLQSERRFAPSWERHSSGRLRRVALWPWGRLDPQWTEGPPRAAGVGFSHQRDPYK